MSWRQVDDWHAVNDRGYSISRALDGRTDPPEVIFTAWTPVERNARGWTTKRAEMLLVAATAAECAQACREHFAGRGGK